MKDSSDSRDRLCILDDMAGRPSRRVSVPWLRSQWRLVNLNLPTYLDTLWDPGAALGRARDGLVDRILSASRMTDVKRTKKLMWKVAKERTPRAAFPIPMISF